MNTCAHTDLLAALTPIPFDASGAEALDPAIVGGKGLGLVRLRRAGLPVPEGCVLPAALYRQLASAAGLDAQALHFDPDDPGLADRCAAIRAALLRAPWPRAAQWALRQLAATLGEAVSVRSSATTEDLGQGACAGQHDSLLNVRPADVPDAVRQCYASLWSERAVRYRLSQGLAAVAPAMAVVVQRMVPSVAAGVIFTVDPVKGDPDVMVVEAAHGLGESVVAGTVETDGFTVRRADLSICHRRVGAQGTQLVVASDGVVTADAPTGPSVSDAQVLALCDLARRAEAAAEVPQDVEWAVDEAGALHLLQSRPITALPARWTRDESAERFPGPMTPLAWDFSEEGFHASLRASLLRMGLPPFEGKWFARFHHHIYGNQNAVRLYLEDRVAGTARDPFASREALASRFAAWRRRHAWMDTLIHQWDGYLARFLLALGRLESAPEPETLPEAWARLQALEAAGRDYFAPNIAISIGHALTWRALSRALALYVTEDRVQALATALTRDPSSATVQVQQDLAGLARIALDTGAADLILSADDLERLCRSGALTDAPGFTEALSALLVEHGHCTLDPDARAPSWGAAPWQVLSLLRPLLAHPPARVEGDALREQLEAEREIYDLAGDEAASVLTLARLARDFQRLDDVEHYQTTRLHAAFRPMATRLGELLVRAGALAEVDDVFFARKATLDALVQGDPEPRRGGLAAEVAEARAGYEAACASTPPWALDGDTEEAPPEGDLLIGIPGAPGTVTAPAFCVRGPEDFGRFPAGAILVARTTHPSWTPLFHSAAAVITESGGPLSHGAVTARELGLPAVMGIRGALSRLEDGQALTINGGGGWVQVA